MIEIFRLGSLFFSFTQMSRGYPWVVGGMSAVILKLLCLSISVSGRLWEASVVVEIIIVRMRKRRIFFILNFCFWGI